jgi:hypothetical protein
MRGDGVVFIIDDGLVTMTRYGVRLPLRKDFGHVLKKQIPVGFGMGHAVRPVTDNFL